MLNITIGTHTPSFLQIEHRIIVFSFFSSPDSESERPIFVVSSVVSLQLQAHTVTQTGPDHPNGLGAQSAVVQENTDAIVTLHNTQPMSAIGKLPTAQNTKTEPF